MLFGRWRSWNAYQVLEKTYEWIRELNNCHTLNLESLKCVRIGEGIRVHAYDWFEREEVWRAFRTYKSVDFIKFGEVTWLLGFGEGEAPRSSKIKECDIMAMRWDAPVPTQHLLDNDIVVSSQFVRTVSSKAKESKCSLAVAGASGGLGVYTSELGEESRSYEQKHVAYHVRGGAPEAYMWRKSFPEVLARLIGYHLEKASQSTVVVRHLRRS